MPTTVPRAEGFPRVPLPHRDPLDAQTTGQIVGIVRDQTGAVIVGAKVTIVRQATGEKRVLMTDQAGAYTGPLPNCHSPC